MMNKSNLVPRFINTLLETESSIINGTMLIQIAILAWIFLGETISLQEGIGMLVAACGAVLVQIKVRKIHSSNERITNS